MTGRCPHCNASTGLKTQDGARCTYCDPPAREIGFYWISRKVGWNAGEPMVALWSENHWWLVGDECERDDERFMCLSGRIKEPANG
jgi:hypothetical protein